jgi:gamma-glutamyl hercynylcysteine S-oxide synthase
VKSRSNLSIKEDLRDAFSQCRNGTLKLFYEMDYETFCCQSHPDFSPVGWHLGHIGYTEDLWLLQRGAGLSPVCQEYHKLLAADGLPKNQRVFLPSLPEIIDYLATIRTKVFDYLEKGFIDDQERLWHFLLQHESQHCETIALVLAMQNKMKEEGVTDFSNQSSPGVIHESMIEISVGEFEMGNNGIEGLDNERSRHLYYLETYYIDPYPVTGGEYRQFMEKGGYKNSKYWSKEGWEWLQNNPVNQPLYWSNNREFDRDPVCGVSWYEAEAYCNFMEKRLPTEAEWEKAASWNEKNRVKYLYPWGNEFPDISRCNHFHTVGKNTPVNAYPEGVSPYGCYDMLGNVWEWTASWFKGYEGFEYYPYPGYSQVYFDGKHRVLKGGSWATRPWAMRTSFRNWYDPGARQIFAGFRCARDRN